MKGKRKKGQKAKDSENGKCEVKMCNVYKTGRDVP
jgi:hypothetical protein